jgi:hypothetical protein
MVLGEVCKKTSQFTRKKNSSENSQANFDKGSEEGFVLLSEYMIKQLIWSHRNKKKQIDQ